ncbi:MAG: exopolyphosphatase, partial [Bacteroidota bacterium]|nr:exopolyphosphatase [Bacteroidota bacterium]
MKLAAIDIGSNAVRLLFTLTAETESGTKFHKVALIRVPVRLGLDSFLQGRISDDRRSDLMKTMKAFALLIDVYGAEHHMGCATSALREAENGEEIMKEIRKETGLDISLIDGELEARLIHATHIAEDIDIDKSYLYIDVGGGSTELTVFSGGERRNSESFKIGTLRLKEDLVTESDWKNLQNWIKENVKPYDVKAAIGTGGNINKLFKLSEIKDNDDPLPVKSLEKLHKYLSGYSQEERVNELGLR